MNKEIIEGLLAENKYLGINPFSWDGITRIIKNDESIKKVSSIAYAIDPRDKSSVLFAPARNNRPKDNGAEKISCKICDGDTPIILKAKDIGNNAYSFINPNPFAFLNCNGTPGVLSDNNIIIGTNLLFWPTTEHKKIYEMNIDEQAIGLELLAELEYTLQKTAPKGLFREYQKDKFGHFQIIKNYGKAVGGSLEHEHYQIGFMNKLPKKIENDKLFLKEYGKSFVKYLSDVNPKNLDIKEYNNFKVVTPYFMRRPLEAIILPKDESTNLCNNNKNWYNNLAEAITDVTYSLSELMPGMNKEFAYNLVFHTGPIGTMYIEVLPYTQEDGGFEKSGLNVCQSTPEDSTNLYKKIININKNGNQNN